jgi:hypothetical protein
MADGTRDIEKVGQYDWPYQTKDSFVRRVKTLEVVVYIFNSLVV